MAGTEAVHSYGAEGSGNRKGQIRTKYPRGDRGNSMMLINLNQQYL